MTCVSHVHFTSIFIQINAYATIRIRYSLLMAS